MVETQNQENQLTQEEIQKRMNLIKENCIFCKIVKGEIEGKVVFKDDICQAILDINPASTGHLLLTPKEHYMMMPMVPDEVIGHLNFIAKSLCPVLIETLDCVDVTIFIANGAAAGQQSQHFLIHLIPRYQGDNLDFNLENKQGKELNSLEVETLTNNLKEKLGKLNS